MLIIIAWWLNIYSSQQPLMIMSWESNTKAILDPSSKPTLYFVPTKHIHNTNTCTNTCIYRHTSNTIHKESFPYLLLFRQYYGGYLNDLGWKIYV